MVSLVSKRVVVVVVGVNPLVFFGGVRMQSVEVGDGGAEGNQRKEFRPSRVYSLQRWEEVDDGDPAGNQLAGRGSMAQSGGTTNA